MLKRFLSICGQVKKRFFLAEIGGGNLAVRYGMGLGLAVTIAPLYRIKKTSIMRSTSQRMVSKYFSYIPDL